MSMTGSHGPGSARGLRIGEVAKLSGLTVRAIRHYQAEGLLTEPARDGSGYRRYGPAELVTLVRISRLRAVGMPLDRIATALTAGRDTGGSGHGDVRAALSVLAAELTEDIERLTQVRDRLLTLAAGEVDDPAEAVADALRSHGLLADGGELPEKEQQAIRLVDALHPGGVEGALTSIAPVLADPARRAALSAAFLRFASLDGEDVEAVALELAKALPPPTEPMPSIDPAVMAELTGVELTAAQRLCLERVRDLLQRPDPDGGNH